MDKLEQVLFDFSVKTFEELAFFMPVPDEPEDADVSTKMTLVRFSGFTDGGFYIKLPDSALPVLAQNILAEDDIPIEQQLDALKEVANVICGNILPQLAGKDKQYRLSAPEIVDDFISDYSGSEYERVKVKIPFDEGLVNVYWHYNKNSI